MASMAIGKAGYQNTDAKIRIPLAGFMQAPTLPKQDVRRAHVLPPPQVCAAGRFRPAEQDWRIGCMSPDPPLCFKGCWGKALGANAKI